MTKNTFTKKERLSGKTAIDRVFSSGKSFFCYPFRFAYIELDDKVEQSYPCSVLMNVPKRLHKAAVARNLLKRRINEAYRLQKNDFYLQLEGRKIQLAILYSAKEVNDYDLIAKKLGQAQQILVGKLNAQTSNLSE